MYMKKMVFVLSLALISSNLFSQESNSKVSYKTNGLWDNWFANVGGGASMYFGDTQQDEANIAERLTWGATASVGKWITPVWGGRLTIQGGAKHTFSKNGAASNPGHKMATGYYASVHADALLNFSNLVAGYKENRVYNFIPYMGVGWANDRKDFGNGSVVAVVGLLNSLRVSKGVAVTLDISGQAVQSRFNDARFDTRKHHSPNFNRQDWDGIGSVTLGLTFGLGGKQNFDKAEDTYVDNTDPLLLADLNKQVNDLTAENENLKNQLKNAPKPVTPEPQPADGIIKNVPNAVQFELNKSVIEHGQEAVIYNVAQYLKNNSDTAVKIEGFADKKTGTSVYNQALSKKRAKAVEDKLIKEYGVSKNRIISSWKGDKVQPYPVNEWNRVVVITVVDAK